MDISYYKVGMSWSTERELTFFFFFFSSFVTLQILGDFKRFTVKYVDPKWK